MTQRRPHTASRAYFGTTMIAVHEKNIMDFLYDEGPHRTDDIAEHLGLTHDHVSTILCNMNIDGRIAHILLGHPQKPYWILAEDA